MVISKKRKAPTSILQSFIIVGWGAFTVPLSATCGRVMSESHVRKLIFNVCDTTNLLNHNVAHVKEDQALIKTIPIPLNVCDSCIAEEGDWRGSAPAMIHPSPCFIITLAVATKMQLDHHMLLFFLRAERVQAMNADLCYVTLPTIYNLCECSSRCFYTYCTSVCTGWCLCWTMTDCLQVFTWVCYIAPLPLTRHFIPTSLF